MYGSFSIECKNYKRYKNHVRIFVSEYDEKYTVDYRDSDFSKGKYVEISKKKYNSILNKVKRLNLKEILKNSRDIQGFKGSEICFTFPITLGSIKLNVWNIRYRTKQRKLELLNEVIKEVFSLFNDDEFDGIYYD